MPIEIIDNNTAHSLGKFTERHFVTIPVVGDEVIIADKHYDVVSRVHEQIDQSSFSNMNKFELILYVETKKRG